MTEIETNIKRTVANRLVVEGPVRGSNGDEPGMVTITEWENGEGWDIAVNDRDILSIHESEAQLLKLALDAIMTDSYVSYDNVIKMYKRGNQIE